MSETNGNGTFSYDDLAPGEFRFVLRGKECVLREPSAGAVRTWRATQARGGKFTNGVVHLEAPAVFEALYELVQLSTFDAAGKPVPMQEIRTWPSRVFEDLARRAQEMAQLAPKKEGEEGPEKNSPQSTTGSSA